MLVTCSQMVSNLCVTDEMFLIGENWVKCIRTACGFTHVLGQKTVLRKFDKSVGFMFYVGMIMQINIRQVKVSQANVICILNGILYTIVYLSACISCAWEGRLQYNLHLYYYQLLLCSFLHIYYSTLIVSELVISTGFTVARPCNK